MWETGKAGGRGGGGGVRSASLGCRRARADRRWRLLCGAGPFLAESRRAGWAGRRARGSRRSSRGSAKSIFVDLQFGRAEPRVNESDGSARRARPRPLRCRSVGGAAHRARGRHERALLRMRACGDYGSSLLDIRLRHSVRPQQRARTHARTHARTLTRAYRACKFPGSSAQTANIG